MEPCTQIETESSTLLMQYHQMLRGGNVERSAANELAGKMAVCSARAESLELHYMGSRLNDAIAALNASLPRQRYLASSW